MAVCQPTVPVFAAVSLMEGKGDRSVPRSMTLMAGPIDTRVSPTEVNRFAGSHTLSWFERHVITQVPWPYPGMARDVYPGFLQLSGFMGMNLDRHLTAHRDLFHNLIETVFLDQALPKGEMLHRGERVDPSKIKRVALMTVEGEKDDISGLGQTEAAHTLSSNLSESMRERYVQADVGHYGVFNGSRFRAEIVPRIVDFITSYGRQERVAVKPKLVRTAKR